MNINWGAFGTVFLVSFGAGVIVIVLFFPRGLLGFIRRRIGV